MGSLVEEPQLKLVLPLGPKDSITGSSWKETGSPPQLQQRRREVHKAGTARSLVGLSGPVEAPPSLREPGVGYEV